MTKVSYLRIRMTNLLENFRKHQKLNLAPSNENQVKCLMFTKNNNTKLKREIDGKLISIFGVLAPVLKMLPLSMKKKLVFY